MHTTQLNTKKQYSQDYINKLSGYPSGNFEMIMIGPKDSSFAINISSVTSVKIVGYMNRPEHHRNKLIIEVCKITVLCFIVSGQTVCTNRLTTWANSAFCKVWGATEN